MSTMVDITLRVMNRDFTLTISDVAARRLNDCVLGIAI
jgi:hypothetical protein